MDLLRARVVGPLEPHATGFAEHLERLGYTLPTRCQHMTLVAHLSRWLAREGLGAAGLTVMVARRYTQARAAAGYRAFRSQRSLDPLLSYLRGVGAAPDEPVVVPRAVDALVERFRAYLLSERGLKPNVVTFYVLSVRPFVSTVVTGDAIDAAKLSARTVTQFVSGLARSLAPKPVQGRASALRALLRYWFLDGVTDVDLSLCVPKVAHRAPGLPKGLPAGQVAALLGSCDAHSANGLRDLAILTMLARMGLRSSEIAGLRLDDVDWRQGVVVVRGKGRHRDRLPLPADVGRVLADYLRSGRPAGALDRCVFVRVKAPHRGLTNTGVTQVVNAARRADAHDLPCRPRRHPPAQSPSRGTREVHDH
jgi:integrase/recombinase XerD